MSQEKLEIINADRGRGEITDQGIVRHLEGNIHLRQGAAELFCEQVTWYVDQNKTVLKKNVRFIDGQKTLKADKIIYHNKEQVAHATGHVVLIDSVYRLTSNRATYYEEAEKITADDSVRITDDENSIILTGQHAEYYSETEYAKATGDPVLTKLDSTGNKEIVVTGDVMELFDGGDRAIVTDNVDITHEKTTATSNKAEYFKDENRILLSDEPIVQQKFDKLSGNEIELFFKKQNLDKVIISGDAEVSSQVDTTFDDSRLNRLLGNTIRLTIEDSRLKQVFVEGQATCYYYIIEDEEYKGLNKIIGDQIIMTLDEGEIKKIIIDSDPQTSSGIYYPPGHEKTES
ncbi:hypothetical protein GF337_06130 [candidate division KSB1 bacterium]|nr:hypothetical protein [candidate division KSB1 bacterium]